MKDKTYWGDEIDVTFDLRRCIHAAECGKRLPEVFDTAKRPWVQPNNASADAIQQAIEHCPSGALKFTRKDGGEQEQPPTKNVVFVAENGEYRIHGDAQLLNSDGETIAEEYRMTLCRCGESNNKPYCDNSHRKARFVAPSEVADNSAEPAPDAKLTIKALKNGPLLLQGNFDIQDDAGHNFCGQNSALCRCGASENKPFCDGSHKGVGFQAD